MHSTTMTVIGVVGDLIFITVVVYALFTLHRRVTRLEEQEVQVGKILSAEGEVVSAVRVVFEEHEKRIDALETSKGE